MCQHYNKKDIWWIPKVDKLFESRFKPKTDFFPVRLCKTCNRVWEKPLRHTRHYEVIYHENFPTYKLTREECNECIKERKQKQYASRRKKGCKNCCKNCKR